MSLTLKAMINHRIRKTILGDGSVHCNVYKLLYVTEKKCLVEDASGYFRQHSKRIEEIMCQIPLNQM